MKNLDFALLGFSGAILLIMAIGLLTPPPRARSAEIIAQECAFFYGDGGADAVEHCRIQMGIPDITVIRIP